MRRIAPAEPANFPSKREKPPVCCSQAGGSYAVRPLGALGLKAIPLSAGSVLGRRIVRRGRPVAMLRHERIELFLVLGVAQPNQEFLELLLLLLEAPQRLVAIVIEGAVAARGRTEAEAM